MWFSSVGLGGVFTTLFLVKVGLGLTFGAIFFLLMWVNLLLTDRFGARDLSFEPEDEIVRRFQNVVRPYAGRIYAVIALLIGAGRGAQRDGGVAEVPALRPQPVLPRQGPALRQGHRLLRLHAAVRQLRRDVAARRPVRRPDRHDRSSTTSTAASARRRARPRVAPRVKAHLSVIGAGIALMKAAGYLIAKWELVNSTNGYVQGAGYTDVHARMPALTILFWLSLAAAVILLANVRSRGWSLPAVAVGLWALRRARHRRALPDDPPGPQGHAGPGDARAALHPAQHRGDARGLRARQGRCTTPSPGSTAITPSQAKADAATLANIRLWDPARAASRWPRSSSASRSARTTRSPRSRSTGTSSTAS